MDNVTGRGRRPKSLAAAGATHPRKETNDAMSTDNTDTTATSLASASGKILKDTPTEISQAHPIKNLGNSDSRALGGDGIMLSGNLKSGTLQKIFGLSYEQLVSMYKIEVERTGTKDNHRFVIYMDKIASPDSKVKPDIQSESRFKQAGPEVLAESTASTSSPEEPEKQQPINRKRKLPLSRTRAAMKEDPDSIKKVRLNTQDSLLESIPVDQSDEKSALNAEIVEPGGEVAAPVQEQVVKKPRIRKPKYRNMCPRDDKGCNIARCEFLHTKQWDYLESQEYIDDGRPWQHHEPFIFTVNDLPYKKGIKLIH